MPAAERILFRAKQPLASEMQEAASPAVPFAPTRVALR